VVVVPALLPFHPALAADITIWASWSTLVGWWATCLPDSTWADDGWLLRLRPWERDGLTYGRLGIRRWKGRLPDLGPVFGGRRKQLPADRDPDGWRVLAGETRRAEWAHWMILLALPIEAVIRSGVVLVPMTAYALVANVPCIATQRYNRARLGVLVEGRRRRSAGPSTAEPARLPVPAHLGVDVDPRRRPRR
jgi:glycosyl-4,4'-diaponeurosporenoate acyltransferase